jgi:hypothetical protein
MQKGRDEKTFDRTLGTAGCIHCSSMHCVQFTLIKVLSS